MSIFKDNLKNSLYEIGEDTVDKTVLNRPFLAIITALDGIRPYIANMTSRFGISENIDRAEKYPYYDNTHYVENGDPFKEAISKLDEAAGDLLSLIMSKADVISSLNISLSDLDLAVSPATAANNWHIQKKWAQSKACEDGYVHLYPVLAHAGGKGALCISRHYDPNKADKIVVARTTSGRYYTILKDPAGHDFLDVNLDWSTDSSPKPYSLVKLPDNYFLLTTRGGSVYRIHISWWANEGEGQAECDKEALADKSYWGNPALFLWRRNNGRIAALCHGSSNPNRLHYRQSNNTTPTCKEGAWTGWTTNVLNFLPYEITGITAIDDNNNNIRAVIELKEGSHHHFAFIKCDGDPTVASNWINYGIFLKYHAEPHLITYPNNALILSYIKEDAFRVMVSMDDGLNWRFPKKAVNIHSGGIVGWPRRAHNIEILNNGTIFCVCSTHSEHDADGTWGKRFAKTTFRQVV